MTAHNIFETISSQYFQLTNSEKKVADYVLRHRIDVQYMSISELAEEAGVAEATISRFCKRLGYKGYSAFKLAVANSTARRVEAPTVPGEIRPEDSIEELCQKLYAADRDAMAQTVELIRPDSVRKAADLLFPRKRCCAWGRGVHDPGPGVRPSVQHRPAQLLRGAGFPHAGHRRLPPDGPGRGTVFFLLRLHGGAAEKPENHPGPESGGHPGHPVPQIPRCGLCDVVLQCGSLEGPLQGGSVAARVAQLYLMDVLFHEVCRRDVQGSAETREAVAEVLSDKHI